MKLNSYPKTKTVTIVTDTLNPESWEKFETEDVLEFLFNYFKIWPKTARLYHRSVCETQDITPANEKDIEKISTLEGEFFVIVYPGTTVTAWLIVSLVVSLISVAYTLLNMPKIPNVSIRAGGNIPSSNNELSERTNKARVGGRIPDIYGEVRSIPDLISTPYKIYVDNIEFEHALMCIGRGEFEVSDVRDGDTPIEEIDGCSVAVYGPNTIPGNGSPQLKIGGDIDVPVSSIYRSNSVNGQVLDYPATKLTFERCLLVSSSGNITHTNENYDFSYYFPDNVSVPLTGFVFIDDYGVYHDLEGVYLVGHADGNILSLQNVTSINPNWSYIGSSEKVVSGTLSIGGLPVYLGPFYLDKTENSEVWLNFTAPNGLFKDNGSVKTSVDVIVRIFIEQLDSNGNLTGLSLTVDRTMNWIDQTKLNVGVTVKCNPSFSGPMRIKAARLTSKYSIPGYQVYDEVRWKDLYAVDPISLNDFGNVTIVQSLTKATSGALELKERKLNMLVKRKIPLYSEGTFTSQKYVTSGAKHIIPAIALDNRIGNMPLNQIDMEQISNTIDEIDSYFGNNYCSQFNYTFDSDNLTFEEIMTTVAGAIFCTAYRRGSKLKLSFEKKQEIATILFNHRNKIPNTEIRTIGFGNFSDNDGVEFQYVSPDDDAIVTIYRPVDKSSLNPKKVESVGIRNDVQANIQIDRIYNKILYQNKTIEFDATSEGNVAIKNDKILVSDGTRSGVFDGEVISQNVLELTLSQEIDLDDDKTYTIFLQLYDGTVESIPITKTNYKNKILLSHPPSLNLVLDSRNFARTTFLIVSNDDTRQSAFILTEKSPQGIMTCSLKAINYDDRYYQNDLDYREN